MLCVRVSADPHCRKTPYTFSFSPGPQRRLPARRSTIGPVSRSKLHTTTSLTHRLIRRDTSSLTRGGGRGSPARRLQPKRPLGVEAPARLGAASVACGDKRSGELRCAGTGPEEGVEEAERSTEGRRSPIRRAERVAGP